MKSISYLKLITILFFITMNIANAAPAKIYLHGSSPEETRKAIEQNLRWHRHHRLSALTAPKTPFRPVEDTANFAYVLMNDDNFGVSEFADLRKTIAHNLPANVKLVILTNSSLANSVRDRYLQWVPANRLIIATDEQTEGGFWARDAFPIPVYDNEQKQPSLVAAHYFRPFNSWDSIANSVKAKVQKNDFTFVGGNLLADEDGVCFAVNSDRLFTVSENDLKNVYGCKSVHIMSYVRGIGDVDEVLKPLPGKRMLTNVAEYKNDLEAWGYQVILLPSTPGYYRTYVNSLIVGDTVFMPIFNAAEDNDAQKVYEKLGYKVFPIQSIEMSDSYNGSVHCQTMAYPRMELGVLLKALHAKEYVNSK